jgi:hypothetical protein
MGRRAKISNEEILDLIKAGKTPAEIARVKGLSPSAITQRAKSMKVGMAKDVTLNRAHQFLGKKVDALEQIQKINHYANEMLDLLMNWNRGEPEALRILESQVRKVKAGNDSEGEITDYKFKDPRELALKAMAEIRGQLKLQLDIFHALFDMSAVAEFQKEVLEAIGGVSPEAREKIIWALQERRAIRSTLEFDGVI